MRQMGLVVFMIVELGIVTGYGLSAIPSGIIGGVISRVV